MKSTSVSEVGVGMWLTEGYLGSAQVLEQVAFTGNNWTSPPIPTPTSEALVRNGSDTWFTTWKMEEVGCPRSLKRTFANERRSKVVLDFLVTTDSVAGRRSGV